MSYLEEHSGSQTMSMSAQQVKPGSKNVRSKKRERETVHVLTDRGIKRDRQGKKEWEVCGL